MDYSSFITKGKLLKTELHSLLKEAHSYSSNAAEAKTANINGGKNLKVNKDQRDSLIYFPQIHESKKTHAIVSSLFSEYTSIYNQITFYPLPEIQYAQYNKGQHFKKHRDVIYGDYNLLRSLTLSINMSDESEYEGGELVVWDPDNKEYYLDKEIGSFIIFPAIYLHEAKSVINGKREAMVSWFMTDPLEHEKFNKLTGV